MRAKPKLLILLVNMFTAVCSANAQPPAAVTGGVGSATGQSAASSPAPGQALVYVYRLSARALSAASVMPYIQVFANGDFLADLSKSSYASGALSPGTVAFTATGANPIPLGQYLPLALRWPKCVGDPKKANCSWDTAAHSPETEDHGCAKVNWRRLGEAGSEDVALCKRELATTSAALDKWIDPGRKRRGVIAGMLMPGPVGAAVLASAMSIPGGDISAWLQMCGPKPFPSPSPQEADKIRRDLKNGDYSDEWSRCKNGTAEAYSMLSSKELLRIEVEAGKTYYVKWHVPYKPGTPAPKMELVDEATGASEIRGLHPAKDSQTDASDNRGIANAPNGNVGGAIAGPAGDSPKVPEQPKASLPLSFNIPNDSAVAVADTGIMLLLDHRGLSGMSPDLYAISGTPTGGDIIRPYTGDRVAADRDVARFTSSPKSCDLGPTNVNGYQVWCFEVKRRQISHSKGNVQSLGVVTSNGRRFSVSVVDFKMVHQERLDGRKGKLVAQVGVEVRDAPF